MHIIQLTGRVYLITNSGIVQKSYMINWFFIYASAVEATSMLGLIWIRLDSLEAEKGDETLCHMKIYQESVLLIIN